MIINDISIQKINYLTCDNWIVELPLFDLKVETISRWKANSLYVLQINTGLYWNQIEFSVDALEEINKYWDICVSKNLDYMNIKFE